MEYLGGLQVCMDMCVCVCVWGGAPFIRSFSVVLITSGELSFYHGDILTFCQNSLAQKLFEKRQSPLRIEYGLKTHLQRVL